MNCRVYSCQQKYRRRAQHCRLSPSLLSRSNTGVVTVSSVLLDNTTAGCDVVVLWVVWEGVGLWVRCAWLCCEWCEMMWVAWECIVVCVAWDDVGGVGGRSGVGCVGGCSAVCIVWEGVVVCGMVQCCECVGVGISWGCCGCVVDVLWVCCGCVVGVFWVVWMCCAIS